MNWFDTGGEEYARSRPDYPPEVAGFLASAAPGAARGGVVVDVGCGTGQFTRQLAARFPAVVGVDPSIGQLAHAPRGDGAAFVCGAAERLPVASGCAALITAAQAAHWFDLPAFWGEVRRVAADGAVVALVTYGLMRLGGPDSETAAPADPHVRALAERFDAFYFDGIGPYWPPERAHVADGYARIAVPFEEVPAPGSVIRREWTLAQVLGYVRTWSAVRVAEERGEAGLVEAFADEMAALWGDPAARVPVEWPVTMRVGRV